VQEIKWVDQCQEIKNVLAARCNIPMRAYFVLAVGEEFGIILDIRVRRNIQGLDIE